MNKLTTFNRWTWFLIFIILFFAFLITIFLFGYKVEETHLTKVTVNSNTPSIILSPNDAYQFKIGDKISLKIGEQYSEAFITKFFLIKMINYFMPILAKLIWNYFLILSLKPRSLQVIKAL